MQAAIDDTNTPVHLAYTGNWQALMKKLRSGSDGIQDIFHRPSILTIASRFSLSDM